MTESRLTPRTLILEAIDQVRLAYDSLHESLRMARAAGGDESGDRAHVMWYYLGECSRKAEELGARLDQLEELAHRATARGIGPPNDPAASDQADPPKSGEVQRLGPV